MDSWMLSRLRTRLAVTKSCAAFAESVRRWPTRHGYSCNKLVEQPEHVEQGAPEVLHVGLAEPLEAGLRERLGNLPFYTSTRLANVGRSRPTRGLGLAGRFGTAVTHFAHRDRRRRIETEVVLTDSIPVHFRQFIAGPGVAPRRSHS